MVFVRNTISGQVSDVPPKLLQHPTFKDILEVVDADAKPYVAELYKSGTKQEKAKKSNKVVFEDVIDTYSEIDSEIEEEI